ncbi:SWI/SNF-related matrix-associated actin-dependent regulator of chromatin subfamily A containing DEAD/H box 1 homolog [Drosophila serrata]|uniref:SWI/SNF-related matrix-associated actin-dependent regulator of chromatin subfamily A containing DEAD/H box 1 homolog n=1 Tax=Drosophila serrata TaxID=7274 RepID=UPI000A1D3467|nr:SWI/SNF-related matrix-associated actin-dependent regulator of chromatin subfamily A containing DEAD/H box 1 homolog [Drosophila serrata]XP_020807049.1 SWI/SNF-related matrix-associated actin-dependent regulator of chromatin subfamily A containing DEAD/H box 1 homolog [Drosophila serrata]XP_020807050.1 SWI/SNF-related matrix-associated actin-dependent regulator of chromatin subfamily A containing DEAD/H box 1 homolog [Drosophila serrata]XP_020807051.1 SWI/SNF-related matrix-associated actin-d
MSDNSAPKASATKSSLSDLRQFRINKGAAAAAGLAKTERVPGKKRISVMADSDSDGADCQTPKKTKLELTVKEKEERYMAAAKISPQYDTMAIQESLSRTNWDVAASVRYLRENCKPKIQGANGPLVKPKLVPSSNGISGTSHGGYSDNDYSDDEDVKQSKDQVYDSDDSDTEMASKMTGQRKKVFQFMNEATLMELQSVKTLSEKKAAAIIELRPFEDWAGLRKKLETVKCSGDLLNYAQDLINKQNTVATILSKCNNMVTRLEKAISTGAGIVEQPKLLSSGLQLADYQIIGLNWLTVMHKQEMNGILADEMGLGKTIQVIAFLAYLKENSLSQAAHLIVVPSSTLDNWEAEISRWCPNLVVEKYHGSQDERRRMRARYAKDGFSGFDVLLTTYHIVGSTPEERKMFRVCKLDYVIFDEAHMLKNMTTQRYANLITINARSRILLTGTPLQNNLLELISLLCFVMPKFFAKSIEDIKTLFAKKSKTDGDQEEVSQFQETQIQRAKRIMKPFVLRRLKKDVLNNLPKKLSLVEKVSMSNQQKQYYHELVEYYSNNKGEICSSSDRAAMTIMMEMRRIANHPLLMRHYFSDENLRDFSKRLAKCSSYKKTNEQYIFEELAIMSDFQVYQLCQKYELFDVKIPDKLICDSGKFEFLDELLPKLREEGHRVLLFSQFTMMLDIVEEYLRIRKHGFCRLDGSTAVKERQDLITDFNVDDNIFVFLLSTKAGGVGINLTAADTCIIHDIDFNPYNDKQAEDRCHRMGQQRPVTIYRLISESTIEEGILMSAEEKLKLEKDITSTEKGEVHEQRCVVKLLTTALGLDKDQEEQLNNSLSNSITSPQK